MKLLSCDKDVINRTLILYSCSTAVVSSGLIFVLLKTDLYLLVGSRRIYPLFVFLIVFELLKWCYQEIVLRHDFPGKKIKTLLSLYKSVNLYSLIKSTFILFVCCIGYYVLTVLYGAQIMAKQEETLMFSILLTLLSALPISVHMGCKEIERLIAGMDPTNSFHCLLFYNARTALVGAWFGAFVIPLDWDRPWQVWPIPCFLGAIAGYSISNWYYLITTQISVHQKID